MKMRAKSDGASFSSFGMHMMTNANFLLSIFKPSKSLISATLLTSLVPLNLYCSLLSHLPTVCSL